MGENFLRKQGERFRTLQDAAYDRVTAPDLVRAARPDVFFEEFACRRMVGAEDCFDTNRLILQVATDDSVRVVLGNRIVGIVDTQDASRLRDILKASGGQAFCEVTRAPSLTDGFDVRIVGEPGVDDDGPTVDRRADKEGRKDDTDDEKDND